jgi:pimeloyl-ACP methyl ester carboxylesterase
MGTIWTDLLGAQVHYLGKKYRTRVIEAGDGPPLILIHGVGGHAEAYSRNLARLGQHFRAMAIDLVWHGLSAKPDYNNRSIDTYCEQILDLLDTQGIDKVSIEGESLGGWTAMWFALHYPDRLNKIVLNTAAGVRFSTDKVNLRPEEGTNLLKERSLAAISNPNRETIQKRLEWLMASPDRVTEELAEIRYRFYSTPETQRSLTGVFTNSFGDGDSAGYFLSEDQVREIRTPTLVLWSDKNPGAGPDAGQRLANLIQGSQYVCINDAAHWPQWEQPEEHDEAVIKFLKS